MSKGRILVVEDEVIIALEIENSLQNLGYEVTSVVNSGDNAIKKAEEDTPDLILMDIRIQGDKDGIDTAEIIRNKFGIPVIFSTAYLDEERIERAKITMPFGYVLKPIQERDLKVTLEMALYVAKVNQDRKKSELMFSQLFLQSKTSTQLYDSEGTCVMVNPVFCELFGVEADMITDGRYNVFKDQAAIDSGVIPQVKEIFEKKKTNRWTINFDIAVASDSTDTPTTRKEKVWIDVLGYPILDSKGDLEYVILQHYDITQRKQAEEAIKSEKELLKTAIDAMNDTFFVFDPLTGEAIRWNKAFCNVSGYSNDEIRSLKAPESYYSVDDLNKAKAAVEKVLKEGYASTKLDLITKSGKRITTEYRVTTISDSQNSLKCIVSIGRQISKFK